MEEKNLTLEQLELRVRALEKVVVRILNILCNEEIDSGASNN